MINSTINPSAEMVTGKVELYNGSALLQICTCEDVLMDYTVERVEESGKFFGFGVCQKTNINLIDIDRVIEITTENTFKNYFGVDGEYISPYPTFYVTEVNRDEASNTISVTAYDLLYGASQFTVADVFSFNENYTVRDIAIGIAHSIGVEEVVIEGVGEEETCFNLTGANLDGTENLREVLNAIAEVTQTIYFINNQEQLVFKRLSINGEPVATITADNYYMLESKTNRRLSDIIHATELGDNVSASTGLTGSTQYIRNNPFWELQENIGELVENALLVVDGLTIHQFNMNWSGNFLLEVGDRIAIELEDKTVYSYILNDVVRFLGYIDEDTQWSYENNDSETPSNPSSLGEVIKQTYARVDKNARQIDLVASETDSNSSKIAALQINTDSINASVTDLQQVTTEALGNLNGEVANLTSKVDAQITPEQLTVEIRKELSNGTTKVETNTGFTFDDSGLTVTKSNSEIKTQITEDGMSVYKNEEEVLTANNEGVKAVDLHATTYLIIGKNSRFEDWGDNRTACFWIGG